MPLQRDSLVNLWQSAQVLLVSVAAWIVFWPVGALITLFSTWRQLKRQRRIHARPMAFQGAAPTLDTTPARQYDSTRQHIDARQAAFEARQRARSL